MPIATNLPGVSMLGVVFTLCGACDADYNSPPEVPEVALRGRFEVTERFLGGRDAVTIVGDCDGDGRIDVVNGPTLFVQHPDGSFASAPLDEASGRKAGTMVDLDGDGALDLVFAGADVITLAGDGACHFSGTRVIASPTAGEAAQVLARGRRSRRPRRPHERAP